MKKSYTELNFREYYKGCAYCDAILLQFKEPKVYDLRIPDGREIYSLIDLSLKKLSGRRINPRKVNCVSTDIEEYKNVISFERLEKVLNNKNLSERIFKMIKKRRNKQLRIE